MFTLFQPGRLFQNAAKAAHKQEVHAVLAHEPKDNEPNLEAFFQTSCLFVCLLACLFVCFLFFSLLLLYCSFLLFVFVCFFFLCVLWFLFLTCC